MAVRISSAVRHVVCGPLDHDTTGDIGTNGADRSI
jgi:hypothetical protein